MIRPLLRLPGFLFLGALVLFSSLPPNHAKTNHVHLELNEGEVLQKYIALCAQGVPERIRSMQALSAPERSYVWRLHLGLFLAQHPTLTRDQQSIVIETLLLATPQLFGTPEPNNPNWRSQVLEPLENLRRRGLQIFSQDEIAQIFADVGGSQDLERLEKYSQFAQLNKGDRKTRFNQISPQDRSDLWMVHFGLNLARHAEWTEQQRAIVLEAIRIASPALYQIPKDKNWTRLVDEPIRLFVQRALLVFSEQEAGALFAELGGDEPKAQAHHVKLTTDGNCSCSRESSYCSYICLDTDCTVLTWGCGTMMLYACNGVCYFPNRRI